MSSTLREILFPVREGKRQLTSSDLEKIENDRGKGFREMNAEEYKEYMKQINESEGFDVQMFGGVLCGGIVPVHLHSRSYRPRMIDLSKQALQLYNQQNNTSYEFGDLTKATCQVVAGMMWYLTFTAVSNETSRTFRAKVWRKICNQGAEVEFCEMI